MILHTRAADRRYICTFFATRGMIRKPRKVFYLMPGLFLAVVWLLWYLDTGDVQAYNGKPVHVWLQNEGVTSSVICSNSQRVDHLRQKCTSDDAASLNLTMDDPMFYQRLLLDETHKLIYCVTPKAGSSSLKTLLKNLSHSSHAADAKIINYHQLQELANLTLMSTLPVDEIKRKIASPGYAKFFVTRHPLSRLVSAYRNLIVETVYSYQVYKGMLSSIRHRTDINKSDRPTWQEFADYLPSDRRETDEFNDNKHWRRQVDLCHPCAIKYDYFMRLETLSTDFTPIMELLRDDIREKNITDLPFLRVSNSSKDSLAEINQLPVYIFDKLLKRYESDMHLYGYRIDSNRRLKCSIPTKNGTCC